MSHTPNAAGQPIKTHLFNFKPRFLEPIRAGTKRQTIRAERKRMPVNGDKMRLQHGSRFKPQLIGFATAELVEPIRIDVEGGHLWLGGVHVEERSSAEDLDRFAVLDGFGDWADMRGFWRAEHKTAPMFTGFRTHWGPTLVLADGQG